MVFSDPSINVVAKRIREASAGGSTFEMSCTVSTQNLGEAGYSVLIQSQESLGSTVRTIMTLSPDNVVQHGGATDPNRRYTPGNITSTHNFIVVHWNLHFILKYIHLCLSVHSGTVWFWQSLVRQSFGFAWQVSSWPTEVSIGATSQRGQNSSQAKLGPKPQMIRSRTKSG